MIISDLKRVKPGYYELSIEAKKYLVTEDSVLKYRLFKGYEISQKQLEECLVEDDFSKIKNKAFVYSLKYLKNGYETIRYLEDRGIPYIEAKKAVEELKKEGKLNEQALANGVAAGLARSSNGPYMIQFKLKNRHFDSNVVEEALSSIAEEDILWGKEKLFKKADARYKSLSKIERDRKMKELLYRHGYESL